MVKKSGVSQGKVYVVEDILDTKLINGLQHYRVKWKGYNFSECTWEPEESFNCSKHILNQFLLTRAQKQPSFKDKLTKISKEKDFNMKLKESQENLFNQKKLVKHSESKSSGQKYDKEFEVKKEQEYDSEEEDESNVKYGYQFTAKSNKSGKDSKENLEPHSGKEKKITIVKREHNEEKRIQQVKIQHNDSTQHQSKFQPKYSVIQEVSQSKNSKQKQTVEKGAQKSTTAKKGEMVNNQISQKVQNQFKIVCVKQRQNRLEFTVLQEGKKRTKSKQEMHQKYPVQLCEYYEKFISFDE